MSFAALHRIVNPVVKWLLGSPLHGALSDSLLVLEYEGHRSGRVHSLPVQYARSGDEIIVLVGAWEQKQWWRNLSERAPVRVLLRGRWRDADAIAYPGSRHAADVAPKLAAYFERFPSAASYYGVPRDASGCCDPVALLACAKRSVVVLVGSMKESPRKTGALLTVSRSR